MPLNISIIVYLKILYDTKLKALPVLAVRITTKLFFMENLESDIKNKIIRKSILSFLIHW